MGCLYLVPTPVGNLEDITLRALRVLKEVDLILAEDTRTTGILLQHYEIRNSLCAHHKFNEHQTAEAFAKRMAAGEEMALVRACAAEGVTVICLPGATAFVPALVNSGLPCERFTFEGFLPQKKGRQTRIQQLCEEPRTMIFYESPYRVVKTLEELATAFGGDRRASVSREISKLHEETLRGTLDELAAHFKTTAPRGEFVIIVEGLNRKKSKEVEASTH